MVPDYFLALKDRVDSRAAPALVLTGYFKDPDLDGRSGGPYGLIIKRRPGKPDKPRGPSIAEPEGFPGKSQGGLFRPGFYQFFELIALSA